jgi:TRAP-type mannitol/chloroaromatic compound transport system permease small subunit
LPRTDRGRIIGDMKIPRRLSGFADRLNDLIGVSIRWLTLTMVIVGAMSALLRYFSRGWGLSLNLTPWIELQWYMFSVVFLLGAAYGLRHDVHVRVDILYSRLSERGKAWLDLAGTLLFLVPFSILMLWVSYPAVMRSWSVREVSPDPGGLVRYPVKALILASFVLLLLQAFSQMVKQVDVIRGAVDPTEERTQEPEVHV